MLTNTKAVLFDMDGTLIDSMGVWKEIDMNYLEKYNLPMYEDLQRDISGMSFIQTAHYFKEKYKILESVEEIMETWNAMAFDKYATEVELKPGAFLFLKELRKKGIKTAICTSNSRYLTDTVLKAQKIQDYIDLILTAKEVPNGKPAPDIYQRASEILKVPAEKCLVFEDVYMGVLAGKNANMKVCAVEDPHSVYEQNAIRKEADFFIRNYDQIFEKTYEVLSHDE